MKLRNFWRIGDRRPARCSKALAPFAEALWKGAFATLGEAVAALKTQIAKVCEAAERTGLPQSGDAAFSGKKAVLPVLLIGQSAMLLPTGASARTPTPAKMIVACGFDRPFDQEGTELAHVFHTGCKLSCTVKPDRRRANEN